MQRERIENPEPHASCRVARGAWFCVEGGGSLTDAQAAERGRNDSIVHSDLMIGSEEVDVDGIDSAGHAEPGMRAGRFVI